jgi:hypothetical protein
MELCALTLWPESRVNLKWVDKGTLETLVGGVQTCARI